MKPFQGRLKLYKDIPMHYRSQLFVPGNRPDRFEKACSAGADLVCIDLEDAVGPSDKAQARQEVLEWLGTNRP